MLTVAATSGGALTGAALLATYAVGMTAPVFVLAVLWDRFRIGERQLFRSQLRVGPLTMPASRALAGTLFVVMGISFVAFQGSSALGGTYESLGFSDLLARLEAALIGSPTP